MCREGRVPPHRHLSTAWGGEQSGAKQLAPRVSHGRLTLPNDRAAKAELPRLYARRMRRAADIAVILSIGGGIGSSLVTSSASPTEPRRHRTPRHRRRRDYPFEILVGVLGVFLARAVGGRFGAQCAVAIAPTSFPARSARSTDRGLLSKAGRVLEFDELPRSSSSPARR
jgi:hypothetical protein